MSAGQQSSFRDAAVCLSVSKHLRFTAHVPITRLYVSELELANQHARLHFAICVAVITLSIEVRSREPVTSAAPHSRRWRLSAGVRPFRLDGRLTFPRDHKGRVISTMPAYEQGTVTGEV